MSRVAMSLLLVASSMLMSLLLMNTVIFVGTETQVTDVYGIKSGKQFVNTLEIISLIVELLISSFVGNCTTGTYSVS
jgi:hypothetical protein